MSRRKKRPGTSSGNAPLSTVVWEGSTFRLADKVGMMPLLRFAKLAEAGADTQDMEALAAMYDLIQQCVAEDEWMRFQSHATKVKAGDAEFMEFVRTAMEVMSKKRPTTRSSDSSDGPRRMSTKSTDDLPSRVATRLDGRPDLQLAVLSAAESRGLSETKAS